MDGYFQCFVAGGKNEVGKNLCKIKFGVILLNLLAGGIGLIWLVIWRDGLGTGNDGFF